MLIPLIAACLVLDVTRELLFKMGASQEQPLPFQALGVPVLRGRHGCIVLGVLVWAVELVLWAQVLARVPLNIAVPIMSATYALVPLAAAVVLAEQINMRRWFAIGLITSGAVMVGATGGII